MTIIEHYTVGLLNHFVFHRISYEGSQEDRQGLEICCLIGHSECLRRIIYCIVIHWLKDDLQGQLTQCFRAGTGILNGNIFQHIASTIILKVLLKEDRVRDHTIDIIDKNALFQTQNQCFWQANRANASMVKKIFKLPSQEGDILLTRNNPPLHRLQSSNFGIFSASAKYFEDLS